MMADLKRIAQTSGRNIKKNKRFWKRRVRDAPAGIALAAGRHHITNFDADSARDAAPSSLTGLLDSG
ncbi:MAG TPA: hypothetical protein VF742_03970, partial [Terracidiphilus sp.]